MKVKITAPDGYKYKDKLTGKLHRELEIDAGKRSRYELVPDDVKVIKMEV